MTDTTVNRLRMEMGLTRPKMLELLGAPGRLSVITMPDEETEPKYLERAVAIRSLYQEWVDGLLSELDEYETSGVTALTTAELQEMVGLRDMHIAMLRHRGIVTTTRVGHEYRYSTEDLRTLIRENGEVLAEGSRMRGPLSYGFLRWLGRRTTGIGLDLSRSDRTATRTLMAVG